MWGVDKNRRLLQTIRDGKSPFYEPGLDASLRSVVGKKLRLTANLEQAIKQADGVLICVSTSISKSGSPRLNDLISVLRAVARSLRRGQLVILRSTVLPGTTKKLVAGVLSAHSHLKPGQEFALAYCPERLSEGNALEEIFTIPHIVSGIDKASRAEAKALFSFLGGRVVLAPSVEAAELAKILDNVYRHVNIALANELALTSKKLGVDMLEAIALSNTSPRTRIMRPGLAGGSCLTKDPISLAYARGHWDGPSLIVDASEVNNRLVAHILLLVKEAFHETGKGFAGSTIAVLGLAYKSGTDDLRKTMAKPLIEGLARMGGKIRTHDPYIKQRRAEEIFSTKFSNRILDAARNADCVIIATDHAEYARMSLKSLADVVRMPAGFVDSRSQFDPRRVSEAGFVYKGIGRP